MATIKAYTDLQQSKTLAEILPIESADMFFADGERPAVWNNKDAELDEGDIPCWSLAALLDVLPKVHGLRPMVNLEKVSIQYSGADFYTVNDNLIDVCYELILKLNDMNLL